MTPGRNVLLAGGRTYRRGRNVQERTFNIEHPVRGWARAGLSLLAGVIALATARSACGSASESTLEAKRFALRVHGPADLVPRIRDMGRECARAVARQLGTTGERDEWVDVHVVADGATLPVSGGVSVKLASPLTPTEAIHKLCVAFLVRECRGMDTAGSGVSGSLDWFAAGCAFDVLFGVPGGYDAARLTCLPVVQRAVGLPRAARVDDLVGSPVPSRWELCYRLYSVHCRLLLEAVRGEVGLGPEALLRILEMAAHGREPIAALSFVVAPVFRPGDGLQPWYERRVRELALGWGHTRSAEETFSTVSELTSVPIVGTGEDGRCGMTRVPLDRLDGRSGPLSLGDGAIGQLVSSFGEAVERAPRLMRPAVAAHGAALQHLREGRVGAFRRGVRRARKALASSLVRQQGTEALVDDVERRMTPFEVRLAAHLAVVRAAERERRELNPALAEYLDRLERGEAGE